MFIKDFICKNINTITTDETLSDAVFKMVKNKTNSLVVVDGAYKPIGIVSSYVIIKEMIPEYLKLDEISAKFDAEGTFEKYAEMSKDKAVKNFMNKDLLVLNENDTMIEAAKYTSEEVRRIIPIVNEEGILTGIITRTAIKNALYKAIFKEDPSGTFCDG